MVKNYNSPNYMIQGLLLLQLLPPRKDPAQAAHAQLQVLLGSAVTFPLAGA